MKNYIKHERYTKLFNKLNKSMNNGYFYEAIFLEYNVLEDRLAAVLAIKNVNVFNSGFKEISIDKKLKKIVDIKDVFIDERINKTLIDRIYNWKNKRNKLIHALLLQNDDISIRDLAIDGNQLVKDVCNASKSIINHYKKENESRIYYALRKDCYIRAIDDFGYIKSTGIFNDLLFDKSGKNFLMELKRTPKSLNEITKNISKKYINTKPDDIRTDVQEFLDNLVDDGYVIKGHNISEVNLKNIGFNYDEIKKIDFEDDFTPKNKRSDQNTQIVMDDYFKKHPYLSNFQIELTSKCNERCIHCYIPHKYKNKNISSKLYYSVLEQLKEMGTLGVTLSGGEPMAHPCFKAFLKEAKKKDFFVHVLSNLTLLDDEIINIMKNGNKVAVQVSLYSMIREHHDQITTIQGSYEKTKNAILKLIDNNIPVQINCPIMKANKDDAMDVIKWGHKHKIRVNCDYAIMAQYNHETGNLANRLSPQECKKVIKDILQEDEDYKKQILDPDFVRKSKEINVNPEDPLCGVGINTCCMVANGNVYPCPGWQGYICGNLNKKSLYDIWNNSKEMQYLRNLRKKDLKKCLKCENKAFCSPCLGRFANESKTGNPFEIANHFCEVSKVNKEVVLKWRKENCK